MAANFASVKLPAALVQLARASAQPLRRSVAGQIEYWATLGRVAEQSGLSALEARAAIEAYEATVPAVAVPATMVPAIPDMSVTAPASTPSPDPAQVPAPAQPFAQTAAASTLAQRVRNTILSTDPPVGTTPAHTADGGLR